MEKIKDKVTKDEKKVCTFKPEINKISKEIANRTMQMSINDGDRSIEQQSINNASSISNRFEQLYDNSKYKEERLNYLKKEQQEKECPFKPNLYKPPKSISKKVKNMGQ